MLLFWAAQLRAVLGTLTLSGPLQLAVPTSGTINGARTGDTIVSNDARLVVNSAARTYNWDGTGSAGTVTNGLTESFPGSVSKNSPFTVIP